MSENNKGDINMSNIEFKAGDVVRLRGGYSPDMVVSSANYGVGDGSGLTSVFVDWFNMGHTYGQWERQYASFRPEQLELKPETSGGN